LDAGRPAAVTRGDVKSCGAALVLAALAAFGALPPLDLSAADAKPRKDDVATRRIRAADARFRYEGRFDFSDETAPVVIWQASRIGIEFEGRALALVFGEPAGQSWFDVAIDDLRFVIGLRSGANQRWEPQRALGPGRHRLTITKRSEAAAGHVRFEGVEIAEGKRAWPPAPAPHPLGMEFFGDSITVGACDEDGEADQWEDRRTHNNARSYGALTAAAFAADYRSTAVSGMGISEGWAEVRAAEAWDRLYPRADAPRADLESWQPDLAFVNLGENDASFTRARGRPLPADFSGRYVALARAIRAAYPKARLVLLRGGMENGAQDPELRRAWDAAVAEVEAGDPAVSHFVFTHWSRRHPRVADHEKMAAELVAWLKRQAILGPDVDISRAQP
jgi:lysophospholipase L1-like esterase